MLLGDVEYSRSMKYTSAEGLLFDRVWGQRGMHGPLFYLGIACLTGKEGQEAVMEVISAPAQA